MTSNKSQLSAGPLFALLSKRAGLRFPWARHASIADIVTVAMKAAGARDIPDYVSCLEDGRASFADLVEQLTVGETYFFREPDQLAYLTGTVLPALIGREWKRPIRMWSAACASGEEAYTLAMSLESFGVAGTVLGTDISRTALAAAREALYGKWSLRAVAATPAHRFLVAEGDRWRVTPNVRQRVTVRQQNLATDRFPGRASGEPPFDVVFCRNVLIYLEPEAVARVAAGIFEALADGGWLFTAASDPPLRDHAPFEHVVTPGGVFYRRPDGTAKGAGTKIEPLGAAARARPPPSSRRKPARTTLRRPAVVITPRAARDTPEPSAAKSAEAHYLEAVTLIDQRRDDEAALVLGRALYLDRRLVAAHFALGLLLERRGDPQGARRAYRNVQRLCEKVAPGDAIPFAGGTCARQLASLAKERDDSIAQARS